MTALAARFVVVLEIVLICNPSDGDEMVEKVVGDVAISFSIICVNGKLGMMWLGGKLFYLWKIGHRSWCFVGKYFADKPMRALHFTDNLMDYCCETMKTWISVITLKGLDSSGGGKAIMGSMSKIGYRSRYRVDGI